MVSADFATPAYSARAPQYAQRVWAEIGNSALTLVMFALVDLGLYWAHEAGHTQLYNRVSDHGWWYLAGSIGLMLLLHDAWFYWTHRLMHHPFLFRHVHKVHHQSVDPSPFAAFSFHPLEALIEAGIYVLFAFLFPVHLLALYGWQLIQMVLNVIGHLGYELYPPSFTTHWLFRWKTPSTHHNMHHARFKGNYGLYFTWWDRWLNTEFADYQETYRQLHKRIANGSLLVLLLVGSPALAQPQVAGTWLTEDTQGHVYLEVKNDRITGQLVWLSKPTDATGNPFTDTNNPTPALRQRPLLNLPLLTGFRASKGTVAGRTNV